MVNIVWPFFIVAAICLSSCSQKIDELMMTKAPYGGQELRIDGYYYSETDTNDNLAIAVFYRDGFMMWIVFGPTIDFTLDKIENDFLRSGNFISDIKKDEPNLGVFRINQDELNFEVWDGGGAGITTYSHSADILNDTTFIVSEVLNNDDREIVRPNLLYHFKQFSPKPDSTNMFIR